MSPRSRRGGYTLVELLAYLLVFGVVVNLAGSLFVTASRLHMMGRDAIDRMHAVDDLASRFSTTVRGAVGVVDEAAGYVNSEDTLVLRLPHDRYAVMGRLRGDDRFVVTTFAAESPGTPEFLRTYPHPIEYLAFESLPTGAVAMRVALRNERVRSRAEHRFVATPRSVDRGQP